MARQIIGRRYIAGDFDFEAKFWQATHGGDHRGAAGHIELHGFHGLRRLERQAAGIEGDTFADQRNFFLRFAGGRFVMNADKSGLFLAAAVHRQEPRELHGLDFLFAPHFDAKAATAANARRLVA